MIEDNDILLDEINNSTSSSTIIINSDIINNNNNNNDNEEVDINNNNLININNFINNGNNDNNCFLIQDKKKDYYVLKRLNKKPFDLVFPIELKPWFEKDQYRSCIKELNEYICNQKQNFSDKISVIFSIVSILCFALALTHLIIMTDKTISYFLFGLTFFLVLFLIVLTLKKTKKDNIKNKEFFENLINKYKNDYIDILITYKSNPYSISVRNGFTRENQKTRIKIIYPRVIEVDQLKLVETKINLNYIDDNNEILKKPLKKIENPYIEGDDGFYV